MEMFVGSHRPVKLLDWRLQASGLQGRRLVLVHGRNDGNKPARQPRVRNGGETSRSSQLQRKKLPDGIPSSWNLWPVKSESTGLPSQQQGPRESASRYEHQNRRNVKEELHANVDVPQGLQGWQFQRLEEAAALGRRKAKISELGDELDMDRSEVIHWLKHLESSQPAKVRQRASGDVQPAAAQQVQGTPRAAHTPHSAHTSASKPPAQTEPSAVASTRPAAAAAAAAVAAAHTAQQRKPASGTYPSRAPHSPAADRHVSSERRRTQQQDESGSKRAPKASAAPVTQDDGPDGKQGFIPFYARKAMGMAGTDSKRLSATVIHTLEAVYARTAFPSDEVIRGLQTLHRLTREACLEWFMARREADGIGSPQQQRRWQRRQQREEQWRLRKFGGGSGSYREGDETAEGNEDEGELHQGHGDQDGEQDEEEYEDEDYERDLGATRGSKGRSGGAGRLGPVKPAAAASPPASPASPAAARSLGGKPSPSHRVDRSSGTPQAAATAPVRPSWSDEHPPQVPAWASVSASVLGTATPSSSLPPKEAWSVAPAASRRSASASASASREAIRGGKSVVNYDAAEHADGDEDAEDGALDPELLERLGLGDKAAAKEPTLVPLSRSQLAVLRSSLPSPSKRRGKKLAQDLRITTAPGSNTTQVGNLKFVEDEKSARKGARGLIRWKQLWRAKRANDT